MSGGSEREEHDGGRCGPCAECRAAIRQRPAAAPGPDLYVARLEVVAARALDLAHDEHGIDAPVGPVTELAAALEAAGLFDAETGTITAAGEALALRVARRGPEPRSDPAEPFQPPWAGALNKVARKTLTPYGEANNDQLRRISEAFRPLRVYLAGGSTEAGLVAHYAAALRRAGVEVTYDWTADVLAHQADGEPALSVEERRVQARKDLEGIRRADLVWYLVPAHLSEGSSFEAGYTLALGKGCVVSGAWDAGARIFPALLSEVWPSHEDALGAVLALAVRCRRGGAL